MVNINSALVRNLYCEAEESTLQHRLAAAVVQNNKQLSSSCCNVDRNLCRGKYTPSVHAEARALLSYYGNKIYYSKYRGWCFYDEDYRARKINIMVIRVNRNGNLANSRPCRGCCKMMRDLGVKRVHYSSGKGHEIVTENVRDMLSIQDSSSSKHFARMIHKYPKNDTDYYKYILKRDAPKIIKRTNLENFIRFNLSELLPNCKYDFITKNGNTYIKIYDKKNTITHIQIW